MFHCSSAYPFRILEAKWTLLRLRPWNLSVGVRNDMCCARRQTGAMRVRSVTLSCKFKFTHINRANAKRARFQRFDTGCALQINHSSPAAVCGKLPRDGAGPDAASPPLKFRSDNLPTHVRKAALISGTESGLDFSTAGQLVA